MKILRIPVHGETQVDYIDKTLEAMQKEVGGYIEAVPISDKLRLIVNEEGKLGAYMLNVNATNLYRWKTCVDDLIFGDAFVTCYDGGEDFTDLSDESIQSIEKLLNEMKGRSYGR